MTYRHMRLLSSMCFINVFTCVYSSDDPLTENLFNISLSDFFSPTCIVFLNYSYKYTYIYTHSIQKTQNHQKPKHLWWRPNTSKYGSLHFENAAVNINTPRTLMSYVFRGFCF